MSHSPVSVIILTYNEETTIEECLSFLDWADDVILVDSFSTDRTVEVALAARSDLRVFQHSFEDFGAQRNYALDETSPAHEWVLFLDADEHCNSDCQRGIQEAVKNPREYVGFFLTCRNMFLGRWIKRCTLYPSWQLRLLKRGEVRYRKEGHGQREVTDGPLGYIEEPYDHYGFINGLEHWIARHNKYSTNEVELIQHLRTQPLALGDLMRSDPILRRRCLKRLAARFGFRPLTRFVYLYFLRFGFLDGWAGFQFCLLRVAHEIHITAKLAEAEYKSSHTAQAVISRPTENQETGSGAHLVHAVSSQS
ncbi:MAG: glycosyltransferase family 2 protein [Planctomycetaceae bacterium]|nr:glycosyltransferase family 2 protein [Planctomycetaceae bacterium]